MASKLHKKNLRGCKNTLSNIFFAAPGGYSGREAISFIMTGDWGPGTGDRAGVSEKCSGTGDWVVGCHDSTRTRDRWTGMIVVEVAVGQQG